MLHGKVDLNLFLVLKTVFEEGGITAAAGKLHLTQPAVSHALSRLRKQFDDELFIRHGRRMVPSALCQKIMPQVINSVKALESTLIDNELFDVAHHKREVKFGLRDMLEYTFLPPLVTDLIVNNPNITVNSRQVALMAMEKKLEQRELDFVIDVLTPTGEDIQNTHLFNDTFTVICREGHPILADLTIESYLKALHARVSFKGTTVNVVDMALANLGLTRKYSLVCEHYMAAGSVVSRSDILLTLPGTYSQVLAEKLPVCVIELPFEVPVLPVHLYWHKQGEHDPVNEWMRNKVINIAQQAKLGVSSLL